MPKKEKHVIIRVLKFHVTFLRIVDCNIVRFLLSSFLFLATANFIACYHKRHNPCRNLNSRVIASLDN